MSDDASLATILNNLHADLADSLREYRVIEGIVAACGSQKLRRMGQLSLMEASLSEVNEWAEFIAKYSSIIHKDTFYQNFMEKRLTELEERTSQLRTAFSNAFELNGGSKDKLKIALAKLEASVFDDIQLKRKPARSILRKHLKELQSRLNDFCLQHNTKSIRPSSACGWLQRRRLCVEDYNDSNSKSNQQSPSPSQNHSQALSPSSTRQSSIKLKQYSERRSYSTGSKKLVDQKLTPLGRESSSSSTRQQSKFASLKLNHTSTPTISRSRSFIVGNSIAAGRLWGVDSSMVQGMVSQMSFISRCVDGKLDGDIEVVRPKACHVLPRHSKNKSAQVQMPNSTEKVISPGIPRSLPGVRANSGKGKVKAQNSKGKMVPARLVPTSGANLTAITSPSSPTTMSPISSPASSSNHRHSGSGGFGSLPSAGKSASPASPTSNSGEISQHLPALTPVAKPKASPSRGGSTKLSSSSVASKGLPRSVPKPRSLNRKM